MITEGKKDYTPYWRTVKVRGALSEKFPGGVESHGKRLEAEGHSIVNDKNGKPKKVKDFEKVLVET
jgi:hypothetical protein